MFTIHEKDQNTALPVVTGLKVLWIEEVNERALEGGNRVASSTETQRVGRQRKEMTTENHGKYVYTHAHTCTHAR